MTTWTVIRCTSGKERAAVARAARLGCSGGWYPTKQVNAISGAKKRAMMQAKRAGATVPPTKKTVPYIPGYVFLPCEVQPHRIQSQPEASLWMAALIVNGQPVVIPDADMCKMRDIPQRLRERMDEIEAVLRAEREARRPVVGGKAVVVDGSFAGYDGTVAAIKASGVVLEVGGLFGRITAPVDMVERVSA